MAWAQARIEAPLAVVRCRVRDVPLRDMRQIHDHFLRGKESLDEAAESMLQQPSNITLVELRFLPLNFEVG